MALPENYKVPESSQFMKFKDGANKFRIVSDIVVGWEGWRENKPFRREGFDCNIAANEVDTQKDQKGREVPKIKHFWAMAVYDYADGKVKTLEITQKGIMQAISEHEDNADWGDAKGYDITVNKSGSGFGTDYAVVMSPPKLISTEVENAIITTKIDVRKIFDGEQPITETTPKEEAVMDDETGEQIPDSF